MLINFPECNKIDEIDVPDDFLKTKAYGLFMGIIPGNVISREYLTKETCFSNEFWQDYDEYLVKESLKEELEK